MSKLVKGSLGNLIGSRSFALTEFEKAIKDISETEERLRNTLSDVTDMKVWSWLSEDGVITNLFQLGKSSRKIRFNEDGFGNLKSVRKTIEDLQKSWEGIVKIELGRPEPHRIAIDFTAVM